MPPACPADGSVSRYLEGRRRSVAATTPSGRNKNRRQLSSRARWLFSTPWTIYPHVMVIQLTPPTTTCSVLVHGGLPADGLGAGGAVWQRGGLPGVSGSFALAEWLCVPPLPAKRRLASFARPLDMPPLSLPGF